MKDFAGNELEIGQKVVCLKPGASNSWMIWGEVIGFTPKKVRVKIHPHNWNPKYETVTLRDPDNVVVPMNPELQDYIKAEELRANITY